MAGLELMKLDRSAEPSREGARVLCSNDAVRLALHDQRRYTHPMQQQSARLRPSGIELKRPMVRAREPRGSFVTRGGPSARPQPPGRVSRAHIATARAAASPLRIAPLRLLSSVISLARYSPGQRVLVAGNSRRACGGC